MVHPAFKSCGAPALACAFDAISPVLALRRLDAVVLLVSVTLCLLHKYCLLTVPAASSWATQWSCACAEWGERQRAGVSCGWMA